jgi:chorismate synthase
MEILGGPLFSVAGAGESHGPGITTIVFGCPPGLFVRREQIQAYLDRRRPGSNRHGTPRNEKDKVLLLAGLYQDDHDALTAGPAITAEVDGFTFATTATKLATRQASRSAPWCCLRPPNRATTISLSGQPGRCAPATPTW